MLSPKASASGTLVLLPMQPKAEAKRESSKQVASRSWKHTPTKRANARHTSKPAPKVQLVNNEELVTPAKKPGKKVTPKSTRQRVARVRRVAPAESIESRATTELSESKDSTAEMLIRAHELSQHAKTEVDFEDIAVACDTAERFGLTGDQLEFALQLHAWAIKHRDRLRVERLQQQLRSEKASQQLRAQESQRRLQVQRARQKLLTEQAADELRLRKIEQQLRAEKANESLLARKLEQQLRAERAEEELKSVEAQQELQVELAEQQLRAQRAEKLLADKQAELELANEKLGHSLQPLASHQTGPTALPAASGIGPAASNETQRWQQLHDEGVTLAEQGSFRASPRQFQQGDSAESDVP